MKNLVDFFTLAEKLECEYRSTRMSDGTQQSVASHSWNMAMMAIVLQPYLKTPVDMEKVLKLCALHDLPEAIAHDIPLHMQDKEVCIQKREQENRAVIKIIGLLKDKEVAKCFTEYDARVSPESKLVKALDSLDACVQHMCVKDLSYISSFKDNFYWKLFFSDDFAKKFDFEPILTNVFKEIKLRASERLKNELGIDFRCFIGVENENS